MKAGGFIPKEVAAAGIEDGLDGVATWKMLIAVFDLSFVNAKDVWIQAKGIANSLDEHQESLLPEIDAILNKINSYSK